MAAPDMELSLKRELDPGSEEWDSIVQALKFRADVLSAQSSEDKIRLLKDVLNIASRQKRFADWTVILLVADIMNLSHDCQYKLPPPTRTPAISSVAENLLQRSGLQKKFREALALEGMRTLIHGQSSRATTVLQYTMNFCPCCHTPMYHAQISSLD